jgi:predicted porin
MKKSLLALAVLGAYAGVASAQSSVQLFGTLDLNGRYIKNDGRDRQLSMAPTVSTAAKSASRASKTWAAA